MDSKAIVLDASVVISRIFRQEGAEWVDLLLVEAGRGEWIPSAPSLLWFEVAHACWKRRALGYPVDITNQVIVEMEKIIPGGTPLETLFPRALEMAYDFGLTVYDASYAALAELLGGTLATFDEDLARRVRKHSNIPIWPSHA